MEKLDLILKKENKIFFIAFILVLITTCVIIFGLELDKKEKNSVKDPVSYKYLIKNNKEKEGEYATIDIVFLQSFFFDTNTIYFYAADKNYNFYITSMKQSTYNKISDIYEKDKDHFSYTINGYVYNISEEIKNAAISGVTELNTINNPLGKINKDNYSKYLGTTYISEDQIPETTGYLIVLVGLLIGVFALIFVIGYIVMLVNRKTTLKKYNKEDIILELEKLDTIYFDRLNIFVSNNYIITGENGLKVIPIKSITKACIIDNKYGFIHLTYKLYVYNKNKHIEIAETRKHIQDFKLLLLNLNEKNDKIRI